MSSPRTRTVSVVTFLLLTLVPSFVAADEVDDVLALKVRNRDRINRFSGEFAVETDQPAGLKNPKTLRMRYRVKIEKIPPAARKHMHAMWRIESEVLEPIPMKIRVEGEQAWYMDQHGVWVELVMTPEVREQFLGMSERFLGADPAEQRKYFRIRIIRRRSPLFGPRIRTVEYLPQGKARAFARSEEDVDDDGLPVETRLYDDSGAETVRVHVKRHHKVSGVPVVDEMESVSRTPAGEVVSRTVCSGILVDTKGGE